MGRTSDTQPLVQTAALMAVIPDDERPLESLEIVALVRRCVAGDSAAFEQIVMRNERRVLNLAWRLLGNKEDAQDAAQEVYLRVFKYIHRFDASKPIEPWLMRLTVNVCRDLGRKRQQQRIDGSQVEDLPTESANPSEGSNPHEELALEQRKQMLRAALVELPERERTALVLRDIEGLSTSKVANIMGSSESTVRSQISTGRVKLKRVIDRKNRDQQ